MPKTLATRFSVSNILNSSSVSNVYRPNENHPCFYAGSYSFLCFLFSRLFHSNSLISLSDDSSFSRLFQFQVKNLLRVTMSGFLLAAVGVIGVCRKDVVVLNNVANFVNHALPRSKLCFASGNRLCAFWLASVPALK